VITPRDPYRGRSCHVEAQRRQPDPDQIAVAEALISDKPLAVDGDGILFSPVVDAEQLRVLIVGDDGVLNARDGRIAEIERHAIVGASADLVGPAEDGTRLSLAGPSVTVRRPTVLPEVSIVTCVDRLSMFAAPRSSG
jgi:hypothetical protein